MGWFGAVFAKLLVVQQAFIEELAARVIKINGAIYGGDRFDEKGELINANKAGFYLNSDGVLKAANGEFSGRIEATEGSFTGNVYAEDGYFKGNLEATSINVNAPTTAGTNYTIRSNNIPTSGVGINTQAEDLKEIYTAAHGQVILQLQFTTTGSGWYKIKVNESVAINWTTIPNTNIISHTLNLPKNTVNRITLGIETSGAQSTPRNTIFRIMCAADPKLLTLLG
jgi:hypothetical protein